MEPYAKFRPTGADPAGAFLLERQDWLVLPVMRTRDSGELSESNFEAAERELSKVDPDGSQHETHRFGHWGPGWFEIILVRPDTEAARAAAEIEGALSEYPVLDEDDFSRREFEAACEAWESTSRRERIAICARRGVSIFAARRDEIPQGLPHFEDFYRPND